MIRLIAYISLVLGIILAIANLTMSHSLAGDGQYLSALTSKRERVRQSIAALEQGVNAAQSIATVARRTRELGFTTPVSQRVVSSSPLALSP